MSSYWTQNVSLVRYNVLHQAHASLEVPPWILHGATVPEPRPVQVEMVEIVVKLVDTHPSVETLRLGDDAVVGLVKRGAEAAEHCGQSKVKLVHPIPTSGVENS